MENPAKRALLASLLFGEDQLPARIGREAYSYRFVYRAFAPLLARWGTTSEVTRPESRLDYAIWQAQQQGLYALHLSFLPLHHAYLTAKAPNIVFPFWEFPDIPNAGFDNNPRNNWSRIAAHADLILVASQSARHAFLKAGVRTPIRVVPVPIESEYFAVEPWQRGQRVRINCQAYVFPQPQLPAPASPSPWVKSALRQLGWRERVRHVYKSYVKRYLPARLDKYMTVAIRAAAAVRHAQQLDTRIPYRPSPSLDLSGVVYTTILNPFDPRKNWNDLLSGFLLALGDCQDATLVVKLVVCPKLAPAALNGMVGFYQEMGLQHRCKLAFVTDYLTHSQMVDLTRASSFYVNTARAEGACLPLQASLAAGRPGIAPGHTAFADYFQDNLGFLVSSHPEPACWPHDPAQRLTTSWHRLVWQSLHDQFRASYQVARQDDARYQELAERGRGQMHAYAHNNAVWPLLSAALDSVAPASTQGSNALLQPFARVRKAS
jgi:glycosyltransferase involved in cell wall biosynthesis